MRRSQEHEAADGVIRQEDKGALWAQGISPAGVAELVEAAVLQDEAEAAGGLLAPPPGACQAADQRPLKLVFLLQDLGNIGVVMERKSRGISLGRDSLLPTAFQPH